MSITIRLSDRVDAVSGAGKKLRVVDRLDAGFTDLWSAFLDAYPIYTYRHTRRIADYWKMVQGDELTDCSFVLVGENDLAVAICPLFVVADEGGRRIGATQPGRFAPVPLTYPHFSERQRRRAEDRAFAEAVARLEREGADRWLAEADILSVGTELIEDQVFARRGALDISIHQHIVDLGGDDVALRAQMRRRAQAEINGGLKTYEFMVFDRVNYTDDIGERHRELHHKTAGRVTRPIESFRLMYDWIRDGTAFMVEQRHAGTTVNMTLVTMDKGTAIGASTADDPEFTPEVPLMHSMMWTIFQECRKRGIRFFEVGETNFRDTMHQILTPKEKNIAYFKRGFGKYAWPQKRWIWFRDPRVELDYLKQRLAAFEAHVGAR